MSDSAVPKTKREFFYYIRIWGLLTSILVGVGFAGYHVYQEQQAQLALYQQKVLGEWVEQNVAGYAADSFVVTADGVYVDRRLVSSEYKFDGVELSFMLGEERHVFRVVDQAMTKLRRIAPAHYESTFINVTEP
ncbi:DUF2850 domain-containing protein [Vibrio sp. SCSIO 43136]|uniref:DUF2850 domain-containing protein n=1 Tax=Vibrio sp. SCSIO 43136 TaxID=2819101 RepID=UPI0020762F10|nr:DUF2850 domain-containing protein [Vibrio sp. SCSIO 43136]USD64716.1 DUF2850 domain-containing protein [Vibrio sp. SCSIO 43136]